MPVMKQLNVGGVTYDTVGEASVTQVVSTGTKIATVSIDGASTDLYAPSGGSSVEPATANPSMDGTAAVGTSVKYAREDHVHPTDTSRAASSHTHAASDVASGTLDVARIPTGTTSGTVALGDHTHSGYAPTSHEHSGADITSGTVGFAYLPTGTGASQVAVGNHSHTPASIGAAAAAHSHSIGDVTNLQDSLNAKQATLVSGTNIKTVNSTSLLGSGDVAVQPTLVSGTNIKTINGNSLLGSGDLTVGGSVTMEDSAVDAAVDAAWPAILHTVTIHSTAEGLVSVDKQSAAEGETVTLTVLVFLGKNNLAIKEYTGGVEGDTYAYPSVVMAGDYYQFTMPAFDLIVTNYS